MKDTDLTRYESGYGTGESEDERWWYSLGKRDVHDIMEFRQKEHRLFYSTYIAVIAGVFLGSVLYLSFYHSGSRMFENGLEDYKISAVLELPEKQVLFYILRRRLGQIFLYAVLVTLFSYLVVTAFFCLGFGVYYGMAVSSFLIKFGIKSVAYLNFCFFPHYLFYFCAAYFLGKWFCLQNKSNILSCKKGNTFATLVQYFVIFLLTVLAIFWEVHFQKNILNFFYQYLVQ